MKEDKDDSQSKTNVINTHVPSAFGVYRVTDDACLEKPPYIYSGENVMEHFYEYVMEESRQISQILTTNAPMVITAEEQIAHEKSTRCKYCERTYNDKNPATRHHDHLSGRFIASACNEFNLQLKQVPNSDGLYEIVVIFNNLRGYDSHHIIQGIFLPESLENLVNILYRDGKQKFHHTRHHVGEDDLVFSKGIYPYTYMNSRQRFLETSLPPKSAFYDDLNDKDITDDEYSRAQDTWSKFKIGNMHGRVYSFLFEIRCDVVGRHFRKFQEENLFRPHARMSQLSNNT